MGTRNRSYAFGVDAFYLGTWSLRSWVFEDHGLVWCTCSLDKDPGESKWSTNMDLGA